MDILQKIAAYKHKEVEAKLKQVPIKSLEQFPAFNLQPPSFSLEFSKDKPHIIAEHKRRSPSEAILNFNAQLPDVVKGYTTAGASAISVLTDTYFFGGSLDDLLLAPQYSTLPLLRKDFMLTPYQIIESKAYGASAVLLIAALLPAETFKNLAKLANSLGLEVLAEIHDISELAQCLLPEVQLIGVNNRNLKTFSTTVATSKRIINEIPSEFIKISESGLSNPQTVLELHSLGYQGFLIGSHFMKTKNPTRTAATFISALS